jgi:hypothetical protein
MTSDEKITEYGKSMHLGEATSFNVDQLIASHKKLREATLDTAARWQIISKEASERAYKAAYDYAMANNYFSTIQLKSMTLGQLSYILNDGND